MVKADERLSTDLPPASSHCRTCLGMPELHSICMRCGEFLGLRACQSGHEWWGCTFYAYTEPEPFVDLKDSGLLQLLALLTSTQTLSSNSAENLKIKQRESFSSKTQHYLIQ
ncbi:hypothetical protein O181_031394 [Austropuccinia psidii MF-1]|uniref:Uncharacterized protein n=1 Tax=Austropuccinia psidii MF-1 TaxID=1389203 RepID=A0A9Q3H6H7_9BASI|nr:hypothetical protein [Austropuccinia psidii MF-1]